MTGDCCVFKFFRRSVDGKHLMRFQSEKSSDSPEKDWAKSCVAVSVPGVLSEVLLKKRKRNNWVLFGLKGKRIKRLMNETKALSVSL